MYRALDESESLQIEKMRKSLYIHENLQIEMRKSLRVPEDLDMGWLR